MSVLEISSKSTLLELLEISVERRGLLKATLSEPHPAPGHVGARGPRGPSLPHPWTYGKSPLWLGPRPSSPAAGEWKRTSERETLGVGASDTPQRTEEPLGTSVSLTAQGFLPTSLPRPPSPGLRLLFSHPGSCNCKSGADHRRTWFPSSTFLHSAHLRQVRALPGVIWCQNVPDTPCRCCLGGEQRGPCLSQMTGRQTRRSRSLGQLSLPLGSPPKGQASPGIPAHNTWLPGF